MNEKIEKIKKQFEDQSATVDSIKRLIEDNLSIIKANVEELREVGSVDRPSLADHSVHNQRST
jgi:L-serine deaminase